MTLAPYVQILGRGPSRARDLTQPEARAAMDVILAGDAAPEAIGAMLMLLRMKGETAAELAGFVDSARQGLGWADVPAALDWPSYAAGRTRGLPWFLLSAKLVAQAGYPVMLHGWNSHQNPRADVRAGCALLGINMVSDKAQAHDDLVQNSIAYVPLEILSPMLLDLVKLRDVLGLRSCINTVLRLLNPCAAPASVQGVFHPSYRDAQMDASCRLGQDALSVIKGAGGEFERHPSKDTQAYGLRAGAPWRQSFAATHGEVRRLDDGDADPRLLAALWDGTWDDDFARRTVLGTAALALHTLGVAHPDAAAQQLWLQRARRSAA